MTGSAAFRLMLVTDRTLVPLTRLPDAVAAAVEGGVDAVQVRERALSHREMREMGQALRSAISGRARLIVNGTRQMAEVYGADGLHLPELAPEVAPAERVGLMVGRSVHSLEAAIRAQAEGCDYVVLGTIFQSRSHEGGPTGGLELVHNVCSAVHIPVIGIGGITAGNAGDVIRAGASGVAVISAILGGDEPAVAARALRSEVEAALAAGAAKRA